MVLIILLYGFNPQYRFRHGRHKRQQWNTTFSSSGFIPEYHVYSENSDLESGEWSLWSDDDQCSRSCGGGVAFQTRNCLASRYIFNPGFGIIILFKHDFTFFCDIKKSREKVNLNLCTVKP